jgi:L-lactate dehydrogenase (cytochrome)
LKRWAGKDGSEAFDEVHALQFVLFLLFLPPRIAAEFLRLYRVLDENLPKDKHLGDVDLSSLNAAQKPVEASPPPAAPVSSSSSAAPPSIPAPALTLDGCLNLDDIEKAAEQRLKSKAWGAFARLSFSPFSLNCLHQYVNSSSPSAYYRSAADDERTFDWNRESFSHVRLRPRVLRNVTSADLSTTLLGCKTSMPVFISPAAMGRLAHPDGEKCLLRAAAAHDIPYIVRFSSSLHAGHDSQLI